MGEQTLKADAEQRCKVGFYVNVKYLGGWLEGHKRGYFLSMVFTTNTAHFFLCMKIDQFKKSRRLSMSLISLLVRLNTYNVYCNIEAFLGLLYSSNFYLNVRLSD